MAEVLSEDAETPKIGELIAARDRAWQVYANHRDPGGLTPVELEAFQIEHRAYHLLLRAQQLRLNGERMLNRLLSVEGEI
jgi:hypothetical protein